MSRITPPALPETAPPSRRHRSRQRELLLAKLRGSDSHPTAAELFESLRPELPSLSLGTVYRNLKVLVAEGLIEAVASEHGAMRYDGNTHPHHHFICESCGAIQDLDLRLPPELERRLRRRYRLRPHRAHIQFFGLCRPCGAGSDRTTEPSRSSRRRPTSRGAPGGSATTPAEHQRTPHR